MGAALEILGRDKMLEAVVKLIQLTQTGRLKWRAGEPDESMKLEADDRIDSVYTTDYNGRRLEIYRRTWIVYQGAGGLMGFADVPDFERRLKEQVVLRLATPEGNFWTFPQNSALHDLMNAVAFKVTDAKGFLDEILGEG
jgi:hypothetical protein